MSCPAEQRNIAEGVKYSRGQVTYIEPGRRCVSWRCCISETIVVRVTVVRRRRGDRDLRMRSTSGPCVLRLARYRYRRRSAVVDYRTVERVRVTTSEYVHSTCVEAVAHRTWDFSSR